MVPVKCGWVALQTGNFTFITDARAINRRLVGRVTNKAEYESRRILTDAEEHWLAHAIRVYRDQVVKLSS